MDQRQSRLDLRNRLFDLIKDRSFRRGHFILASGKESTYYFDSKPTMLHPEGAALLAELILEELQDVEADCVGGLEMGAVPLIAPVAIKSLEAGRALGLLRAQGAERPWHQAAHRRPRCRGKDCCYP